MCDIFPGAISLLQTTSNITEEGIAPFIKGNDYLIRLENNIGMEVAARMKSSYDEYRNCGKNKYNPSEVKIGSFFCFWVKKLKPYSIDYNVFKKYEDSFLKSKSLNFVNEICAVVGALHYVSPTQNVFKMSDKQNASILGSLFFSLRYESVSIPSLISIFQSYYKIY